MAELFYYLGVVIVFLIMISVLVAAHEMGHYVFARLFNMGVEEFAIGFGKRPIWTYWRREYTIPIGPNDVLNPMHNESGDPLNAANFASRLEGGARPRSSEVLDTPQGRVLRETTNFTIRPLPLGGFVRIKGMLPEDDGAEVRIPGGFYSRAPWKRFIVLLAGPMFSVLAGVALLTPLYMTEGIDRNDPQPVLGEVAKGKPAYNAGLRAGDRILSIDGKPVTGFFDIVLAVRDSAGRRLPVKYGRNGAKLSTFVTPESEPEPTPVMGPDLEFQPQFKRQAKIGVLPLQHMEKLALLPAFVEAVDAPISALEGIYETVKAPSTLQESVGGPATMFEATSERVREGFAPVVELAALLSISVGVFNLLPVFPLDGGQMAMAIAEMFRGGRRLSMRVQNLVGSIGMAIILVLVFGVMFVDFRRFTTPQEQLQLDSTPAPTAKPVVHKH
jgi:regulator of sigma E protease